MSVAVKKRFANTVFFFCVIRAARLYFAANYSLEEHEGDEQTKFK
jgi:hypothetical protein